MFKDSINVLTRVGEIIARQIPEPWLAANVEAEIDEGLADLCVWYFDEHNQERYFEITRDLTDCFVALRKLTSDPEKGMWSKCLFTLTNDGKFNTEFSYGPYRWD